MTILSFFPAIFFNKLPEKMGGTYALVIIEK